MRFSTVLVALLPLVAASPLAVREPVDVDVDMDIDMDMDAAPVLEARGGPPCARRYTVAPGDNCWALSQRFYPNGATYSMLLQSMGAIPKKPPKDFMSPIDPWLIIQAINPSIDKTPGQCNIQAGFSICECVKGLCGR